jgi:hydroxyacylglutathione hydrolase
VGGVQALVQAHHETGASTSIPVYGPPNENIPGRTVAVEEGDRLTLAAGEFSVIAVPGHTAGHVAYVWQDRLFCGDTLFALGCGRLFEGTPAQMLDSLHQLAALPGEWYVHCAHEYTLSNLAFALAVDANNPDLIARAERERARRAQGLPTVPSRMSEERATNPFLRAQHPAIQASVASWAQKRLNSELEVWTALREWKNQFKV